MKSMCDHSLDALLGEPGPSAARRAATIVSHELPNGVGALVLCGAGYLGRAIRTGLGEAGISPIAFADNARHLHGTEIDGIPVLSIETAVQRHPAATFVTTIYNPSRLAAQLRNLGVRPASTRSLLLAGIAGVSAHAAMAGPDAVLADATRARAAVDVWADDESRAEYEHLLRWMLLCASEERAHRDARETYFPADIIPLLTDERFADCGAFDGDSIRAFLASCGGEFGHIDAIEPDPDNQARIREWMASLPESVSTRISVHGVAAGASRDTLRFVSGAGAGSTLSAVGDVSVPVTPLDDIFGVNPPTFIKIDVEGAELDVIAGARKLIATHAPVLAVCLYHRPTDLWSIPLTLRALQPGYRLFLRRYAEDCWETVCYAVPPHRVRTLA